MSVRPAILAAAVCALMLAVVPSANAAKGMEVAVQDDPVLLQGLYSTPSAGLTLAAGLHATWIRVNVQWAYVVGRAAKKRKAPSHVHYNWSGYDNLLHSASARGMLVQLALTGPAPAWATANHKIGPVKPKASPFKAFALAAAQHFKGRVTRYSIWNEPNFVTWISPLASAARVYRALYLAGYSAIKGVDPSAQVLIGETSPFALKRRSTAPLAFLRAVTCANARYKKARTCGTLKTDGYAHHPYDFRHSPTFHYPGGDNVTLAGLSRLTSALVKLKNANLLTTPDGGVPEVYLTEYGFFASGKFKLSPSRQGSYLVKAFTMAQKNPHVREMLQFVLVQPSSKFRFFDTSLANRRGRPGRAYKKLAAWATKAASAGDIAIVPAANGSGSTSTSSGGSTGSGSGSSPPPGNGGGSTPPPSCAPLPVCP
jgi:hypothetical protein